MAEQFSIKLNKARESADAIRAIHRSLESYNEELNAVYNGLGSGSYYNIKVAVKNLHAQNVEHIKDLITMKSVLDNVINYYHIAENGLSLGGAVETIKDKVQDLIDQMTIGQIVEENFPDVTEIEDGYWFNDFLNNVWYKDWGTGNAFGDILLQSTLTAVAPGAGAVYALHDLYGMLSGNEFAKTAMDQMLWGDLVKDGDTNWAGFLGSVIIGCIPVVGQAADIRDFGANLYWVCNDGATSDEVVSLLLSGVAFIPALGDIAKHGDELLAGLGKTADEWLPALAKGSKEIVQNIGKNADEFLQGAGKYADEVLEKLSKNAGELTEKIAKNANELGEQIIKKGEDAKELIEEVSQGVIKKVDDVTSNIPKYVEDFNKALDEKFFSKVDEGIDAFQETMKKGTEGLKKADEWINAKKEAISDGFLDKVFKKNQGLRDFVDEGLDKKVFGGDKSVGEAINDFIYKHTGLEKGVKGWMADGIDALQDYFSPENEETSKLFSVSGISFL